MSDELMLVELIVAICLILVLFVLPIYLVENLTDEEFNNIKECVNLTGTYDLSLDDNDSCNFYICLIKNNATSLLGFTNLPNYENKIANCLNGSDLI